MKHTEYSVDCIPWLLAAFAGTAPVDSSAKAPNPKATLRQAFPDLADPTFLIQLSLSGNW